MCPIVRVLWQVLARGVDELPKAQRALAPVQPRVGVVASEP